MRWVFLGRFGEASRRCAVFVLGRHDVLAAILEPKARSRTGWHEFCFRAAVRDWVVHHFAGAGPLLGLQYALTPDGYETEWLLFCPACGAGPFHVPCQAGEAGTVPRTWDDRQLIRYLAEAFRHVHQAPDPGGRPAGGPPERCPADPDEHGPPDGAATVPGPAERALAGPACARGWGRGPGGR